MRNIPALMHPPRKPKRRSKRCGKTSMLCAKKLSAFPKRHSTGRKFTMRRIVSRWMKRGFGLLIPVLFLIAGCANSQQEMRARDRSERARSAYLQVKSNRNVEAFAPLPFADAGKAMQAA